MWIQEALKKSDTIGRPNANDGWDYTVHKTGLNQLTVHMWLLDDWEPVEEKEDERLSPKRP